ncbi:MAG: hypothetical protein AYK22_04750 [Thermoplasmatales archaeon SG8-52-3]|nr:MAG: hypothetical protein AYK22_04750 [Thermoplasmatales archaeon SG8-52-3]
MVNKICFWKKIYSIMIIFVGILAIVVLFSFSVKADSSNEIVLNFSFTEPSITQWSLQNSTFHNVTMNNTGTTSGIGLPMLPMKQLRILLPQKGIIQSINVNHSSNISLGYGYNVTPDGLLTNFSEEQQNPYNDTLFNSSKPYPIQLIKNLGIGYYHGYKIFMCNIYPVYYINDTGEVYYYHYMNLTITTNNSGNISRFFRGLEQDEILMKELVDDYSMNYTYNSTMPPPNNSTIVKQGQEYDFVIITDESFVNANSLDYGRAWSTFQDLAIYKNDYTDFKTKIVTIQEILNDPAYYNTGEWGDGDDEIFNDPQCRIRNFIKHAYWEENVKYFLLGGDVDIIPARIFSCICPTVDQESPMEIYSDLYYACLYGSFNEDKDEYWGEPFDGAISGDWEDPPNRFDVNGNNNYFVNNNYYAEVDIMQYEEEFEVGLFTLPLDLSECEDVTLKFESNYKTKNNAPDSAEIRVYSMNSGAISLEITYDDIIESGEATITQDIIVDFENNEEVYVEFYYYGSFDYYGSRMYEYSWNIDNILIYEKGDPTNIFLKENFDKSWVDNNGDLVPSDGWSQKMYSEAEGKWTKEHYRDDVDLVGEVYVGRAPVGSIEEVSNFVSKTIEYEIIKNNNVDFLKKLLLVGGRMHYDEWGKEEIDKVYLKIPGGLYREMKKLYDEKNDGKTTYYKTYGKDGLINALNRFHLIYNMDHGSWRRIADHYYPLEQDDIMIWFIRFNRFHANILSNEFPFFWYSGSCSVGKYQEEDCLAEHLTVKSKNGAFAVIMNTNSSFLYNYIGEDKELLEELFFKLMCRQDNPIREIGGALQVSKDEAEPTIRDIKYNWELRVVVYTSTLFGDPSVKIKRPKYNNEPDAPENINYEKNSDGSYIFNVNTTDPENDEIQYIFKVNNITLPKWTGYYNSGNFSDKKLYLLPGVNEIMVRARDIYGACSNWSIVKEIEVPFNSNIQTDNSLVVLGNEIQFSGLASGGSDPYTLWYYNFGDDNYSELQNPSHTYGALGTYNVTLNVTDSQNISSNTSKEINVVLLNAAFESSPGIAVFSPEETFYFNDKSKGYYGIVNWSWDFGDGNTSYQRNTSHVYSYGGAYNVSLTITDAESNSDTFYQMIYIDSVSPSIESVFSDFEIVGYGSNVTISVNTSDNLCGIEVVKVNITYPDSSYVNYTLNNIGGSIYEYVFSDCYQLGEYSYIVWVVDQVGNGDCASEDTFVVSRSFGYNQVGVSNQSIWGTITGSVFSVNEKGVADNISVYLDPGNTSSDYHYACMIYHHNGSELVGISEEKNISCDKGWQTFNFSVPKPVLLNDTDYVIGCWSNKSVRMYYDDGDGIEEYYDDGNSTLQGHYFEGVYNYTPDPIRFDHEDRKYSIYCCYTPDNTSPEITNVLETPDPAGFGFNVTITADIIEYQSGVDIIKVNITYPNSTQYSYNMNHTENGIYKFVFNDTWIKGQYNYSIWVVDYANNSNISTGHSFTISGQATISICTIKDSYTDNEAVNLTDPPGNSVLIGYELLDNGDVLRIWNRFDSYYFDTGSGIQLTNHYNDYWSHNVLMLGYYNNDQWNLIYRNDDLSGFNKEIESDNETFVNATLWKDLSYGGYNFRLAIRYHLDVNDNELTVIPYIKNLGGSIPYNLGFGWEMKDIQINMTPTGDYINVNRTMYYLNQTLDNVYTDLSEPVFYLMENITDTSTKSLYLRWNQSLNYKLRVKSRTGQYNAPLTLFIRIGTLDVGQEKYTEMFWYDAEQVTYYFDSFDEGPYGEVWAAYPNYMVDGNMNNYASTTIDGDVELCDENNCSGDDLGTISKVELRVSGYYSGSQRDTILCPVFGGTVDGMECRYDTTGSAMWSQWFDITYHQYAPQPWGWTDIVNLDCDVVAENIPMGPPFTLYCCKIEIRVTYTPSNYDPVVGSPVPADGATGVGIQPVLNLTVSDPDGDNMNITWLSNSSGSWQAFGTNSSVGNGTYHQIFSNTTVNGLWWYWKVNISDGISYVESDVFSFFTGYQSKIENTGSTDFKGYLLMQIEYYDSTNSTWIVDQIVINETSPRIFNVSSILGLDTLFNVQNVSTSSYSNGYGTYRVYVALRDLEYNVLVCDDESLMEDSCQFTFSSS